MFLVVLWMVFILIETCTNDVHAFIHEFSVSFTFQPKPVWQDFTLFYPIEQISEFEVVAHFLLFFGLTLLLADINVRLRTTILISVSYAILTEFLQMYFNRGAELYDIMANIMGIMVAVCIIGVYRVVSRHGEVT
ncbi:VanZ family protein [Oceanobacillus polygoni]|uniref:VanZ family protein n=1 Tax=Oceanobacillus polygoni TaxID=1235259 RepID=A0A9X1C9X4_9BACI|nr:VanZ family protein [Oceanobacillus polygoni]MBP2075879.1 VanZ family protein [Oceanobacillus polygoni]